MTSNYLRKSVMNYKFIFERIITLRLKGQPHNISVIQCYAPTEDADDEDKMQCYDLLNKTLADVPKHDLKILMGDLNAMVGSNNVDLEHVMGRHRVGEINENGELLVELCGLNELRIGGSLYTKSLGSL